MPSSPDKPKTPSRRRPWWREPMMWLVVGGPVVVVIASIVSFVLAVTRPDPLVVDDAYTRGLELSKQGQQPTHTPAMSARNHAATGGNAR